MKKLAVLVAVVSIAALAAPALSATNPFMDVPMNHWAYDAIGQLAAHGILSGYPDGLYKGKQQTTRYEMASALARALAVVDMTKASKQDVEMLKRLVVEFKDELEALGVRVDELDERVAVLEERLGGWHIHGVLALDLNYNKAHKPDNDDGPDGNFTFDDAKLFFERTWGEDDEYFFRARLNGGDNGTVANFDRFYAEMPFFFDTRLTVGLFSWNWESAYKVDSNIGNAETGGWHGDAPITDWKWTGFGLTKNFALGNFQAVVAHVGEGDATEILNGGVRKTGLYAANAKWYAWMLMLGFNMQFTEQIGLDLGAQAFIGDNAEHWSAATPQLGDNALDKFWTIWAGLRFNFNDNIGLKGVFYHQKMDTDEVYANNAGTLYWGDSGYGILDNNNKVVDDANHWAVMFDAKQEALKYTSIWLEYGQYDQGFVTRSDSSIFFGPWLSERLGNQADQDVKYWRIALGQEWNDKWATHIFYYGYKIENGLGANRDAKPKEMGVGVQYKLNDYTTMGLNYIHTDTDDLTADNDDSIRFRTSVSF
ncbi:MAG: S-layer homology domain-containing protein [Synergistaceae bacterium]|nr:S-layer homology domain-containing protein [Synergistaceae bacterium]